MSLTEEEFFGPVSTGFDEWETPQSQEEGCFGGCEDRWWESSSKRVVLVPGSEDGHHNRFKTVFQAQYQAVVRFRRFLQVQALGELVWECNLDRPRSSSDEEPLVRSVAERQVCFRVDEGTQNMYSLRSEGANRDARPTEVDSTRFEDTPDVADSTPRVPR